MLFESEKSRELHIPNMYAFGRGEFLDQTVVLFMFPSSNSKDGCFSGKRCMVQLLQGMIAVRNLTAELKPNLWAGYMPLSHKVSKL